MIQYEYDGELIKVVDGDTVDLKLDLGFYMSASLRFRLLGVDTPELRGGTAESKAKAKRARDFVLAELSEATRIVAKTYKADSFGRWLADITYYNSNRDKFSHNLSKELIANGLGVERLK